MANAPVTRAKAYAKKVAKPPLTVPLGNTTGKIAFRFDGKNAKAAKVAQAVGAKLVTFVTDDTMAALRAIVVKSIRDGIPPYDAAKSIVGVLSKPGATTNEMPGMLGLNNPQILAAFNYKTGLIDMGHNPDTVDRLMAKYVTRKLRERSVLIARTECLQGDTSVSGAVVSAIYRRWYQGDIVEITTYHGRKFSASPNHPMLTSRGWMSAGVISKGDYLICDDWEQNPSSPRDKDIADPPPTIRQIFDSIPLSRVEQGRGYQQDFHGDGRQGKIDIARPDGALMIGRFSPIYKEALEHILSPADLSATPLCMTCGRLLAINHRVCFGLGSQRDATRNDTVANRGLAESDCDRNESDGLSGLVSSDDLVRGGANRLGRLASSEPCLPNDSCYPRLADSDVAGDFPRVQTAAVKIDRVLSVVTSKWAGHIFNLSTPYGYFAIENGVYTGNTMFALNTGAEMGYIQAAKQGALPPEARISWITTPDERLCSKCAPMNGKTKPIGANTTFSNGSIGPPLHPACRCGTGIVLAPPEGEE